MRRVIVTGSRDWPDPGTVWNVLRLQLALSPDGLTIVHGHCPTGADKFADIWCDGANDVTVERHPADWAAHGKAAGPLRNQEMVDTGADQVLAFLHEPDGTPSRGTRDCIKRAEDAGIPVDVIFQSRLNRGGGER